MQQYRTFSKKNFIQLCKLLTAADADLQQIIVDYGYPPMWNRKPGFETLVQIILEQQVSLASAKAAYTRLKERLINITPSALLALTDEELKACYFSRQKISYTRALAKSITSGSLKLSQFGSMSNDAIRTALTTVKGIGNWTSDVYLMMAMRRTNLFPPGDVALIKSLRETKRIAGPITTEMLEKFVKKWAPYQTIAAYILWHAYLSRRKK